MIIEIHEQKSYVSAYNAEIKSKIKWNPAQIHSAVGLFRMALLNIYLTIGGVK